MQLNAKAGVLIVTLNRRGLRTSEMVQCNIRVQRRIKLYESDSKIAKQDPEKSGRKTGRRHGAISPNCATKKNGFDGILLIDNGTLMTTAVWHVKSFKLGVLRTKSGRSNLPSHLRSMSMSCSDKVLR